MMKVSRKSFIGGLTAAVAMGGGGCASLPTDRVQRPADDWKPSARWRGFNLLETEGTDPRADFIFAAIL